jgi:protocatechuate 3,4-dioxygenase beta subunit
VAQRNSLFGVVRDAEGGVLANAPVTLHWRRGSLGTRTAWDGSYRFTDLPVDSGYKVKAAFPRHKPVVQGSFAVVAGNPNRLDFALRNSRQARATGALEVLARTLGGGSLRGARVEVLSGPEDGRGVTDGNGRCNLRLEAGVYRLSVTAPGHRAGVAEAIRLRPGGREQVILRLPVADTAATTGAFFGVVWDPIDRTAPGAQVSAIPTGPFELPTTTADARGEYRFETITAREWLLRAVGVNRVNSGWVLQQLAPGNEVRVDLDLLRDEIAASGAQLIGTVTDTDGRVIPNATITANQIGNPVAQTLTADNGRFVLDGLAPGPYSVRAERAGFQPQTFTVVTTDRRRARADFRLGASTPGPGRITGVVRTRAGVVLAGARVRIVAGAVERSVLTDATGAYVFPQLPPGPYRLRATRPGFRPQNTNGFPIEEGQTVTQDFGLRRR